MASHVIDAHRFEQFIGDLPDLDTNAASHVYKALLGFAWHQVYQTLEAHFPDLLTRALTEELANEALFIVLRECRRRGLTDGACGFKGNTAGELVVYTQKIARRLVLATWDKKRREWAAMKDLREQMELAVDSERLTVWELPNEIEIEDLRLVYSFFLHGGAKAMAEQTGQNRGTVYKRVKKAMGRIRKALHAKGLEVEALEHFLDLETEVVLRHLESAVVRVAFACVEK